MKIITTDREIIYSNACGCSHACGCSGADGYSNVNGNDKRSVIRAFQEFANKKGFKDLGGKPLVVDGIWGNKTSQAAALYGTEFDTALASDELGRGVNKPVLPETQNPQLETKKPILDTIKDIFNKDETNPAVSSTKTPEQVKADKKKKMIKVALIAGGAIALTVIIIAIVKRKK